MKHSSIDNLNEAEVTLSDFLEFNEFLLKFKSFLQDDMCVFKKSLTDLI